MPDVHLQQLLFLRLLAGVGKSMDIKVALSGINVEALYHKLHTNYFLRLFQSKCALYLESMMSYTMDKYITIGYHEESSIMP